MRAAQALRICQWTVLPLVVAAHWAARGFITSAPSYFVGSDCARVREDCHYRVFVREVIREATIFERAHHVEHADPAPETVRSS